MNDKADHEFLVSTSTDSDLRRAVEQVCGEMRAFKSEPPDLAVVYISHHHAEHWGNLANELAEKLKPKNLIGCSAESVVETMNELEEKQGFVVWCAWMNGANLTPLRLGFEKTPDGGAIVGWPDELEQEWPSGAVMLLLADPFTFPADYLLERVNEDHAGAMVVGGMASGASEPGVNRLFYQNETLTDGAVGIMFDESARIKTIVSQGCRPIGDPLVITKADRNIVEQLGGVSALQRLEAVFHELPTHEQLLVQRGLLVGRVMTEYQDQFEAGDFLIRNVLGVDREAGAIAIADYVRPGQTIQFHVRDELAAHRDLELLLRRQKKQMVAKAGLLFTCNGRGSRMFSEPSHDASTIGAELGSVPLAGFFAQGEIGPIAGKNLLHGFTASLALFH